MNPDVHYAWNGDPFCNHVADTRESGLGVAMRASREQELKSVPDGWHLYRVVA